VEKELKERLADFFEADELVEYLVIPVEDIVEAFEDVIEERLDSILELMGVENGEQE
jgi:hypothetical protein